MFTTGVTYYIVTSPLTPAENHAAYIASLNSTNTYFANSGRQIKRITEIQIGQWYKVNAFIGNVSKTGKKYLTAKITDTFNNQKKDYQKKPKCIYLIDLLIV